MKLIFIITTTGVGGAETMLHAGSHAAFAGLQAARNFDGPGGPNRRKTSRIWCPGGKLGHVAKSLNPIGPVRLIRDLRRLKPDLVHTWMYHADLIGGIAARLAGVPALAWGIHHSNLAPADNKSRTLAVVGRMRSCRIGCRTASCVAPRLRGRFMSRAATRLGRWWWCPTGSTSRGSSLTPTRGSPYGRNWGCR